MERVLAILCSLLLLGGMTVLCASAQPYTDAEQIPVTVEQDFPAAVEELLMDEVFIENTEYLSTAQLQKVIDGCSDAFTDEDNVLVKVPTEIVVKTPALKQRATVECTKDYVYSTYYKQGVKYEWIHYLDGSVQKTVSYDYEERTADFAKFNYSIVNHNNESLEKGRVEIKDGQLDFHLTDFLFGMATAVILIMIAVLIVRFIKKM